MSDVTTVLKITLLLLNIGNGYVNKPRKPTETEKGPG